MNQERTRKVLVADDNKINREVVAKVLSEKGWTVIQADNGQSAIEKMSRDIDIALLDLRMPLATGEDCLKFIKSEFPLTEVIIVSGAGKLEDVVSAIKKGAYWYLPKPVDHSAVLAIIDKAVSHRNLIMQNSELVNSHTLCQDVQTFTGNSEKIKKVHENADRLAKLTCHFHIEGELGTGKTTIARYIHGHSSKKNGPFVMVDAENFSGN